MKFRYASALALALFFLEVVGCKRPKGAATRQPEEGVASSAQVQRELPPEPPPALADKAGDVPGLEAALAKDAAYQKVWSGPRGDLNTFLSVVSELIATGGSMPTAASSTLKAKKLNDAAIKLFMIGARVPKLPADFMEKLSAHLDATKSESHRGTWTPSSTGAAPHDYSALAAWARPDDATYLREHIAAKDGSGPFPWPGRKDQARRPWLVDEAAALERLAILGPLTTAESARASALKAEASKPRQPKLGEDFKLGDFTYTVKSVEVVDSVGSGFAKKNASDGARFVLVHFAIRNDGDKTEAVLTDDFRITDARDREYRPSSDANTALVMAGGKDLAITELQPGIKKSITTGFEVPEGVATGVFTLVIPEKGLLGIGRVRITLK